MPFPSVDMLILTYQISFISREVECSRHVYYPSLFQRKKCSQKGQVIFSVLQLLIRWKWYSKLDCITVMMKIALLKLGKGVIFCLNFNVLFASGHVNIKQ